MEKEITLQLFANKVLPELSGSEVTYNAEKNIYLTAGYTSLSVDTYFKAIRFSNRLIVYYNVGVGYCRTFLNGITLFSFNRTNSELICHKTFDRHFFCEQDATTQSIMMLKNYLQGQVKLLGIVVLINSCYGSPILLLRKYSAVDWCKIHIF